MSAPTTIGELFDRSGGKSHKFDAIGASVTGTIESATVMQVRNFEDGQPEFWSDGQPKQQVRIALQTSLRDVDDDQDDGVRNVYVKGWGDQLRELKRVVKAAGGTDIEIGATFTMTYVRDGELPAGKRGGMRPKVYSFSYARPNSVAGLLVDRAPAQQSRTPSTTPADNAERAAFEAWKAQQQVAELPPF
jgi:hypothetical protein